MVMLMLFSAITCPCLRPSSLLESPVLTASTYFAGEVPKILNSSRISIEVSDWMSLAMRRAPMPLQTVPVSLADAVEDDRDADDRKAVEDALREVLVGDSLENVEP